MSDFDILVRSSSLTGFPDCERRFAARAIPEIVEGHGFQLRRTYGSIGGKIGTATHAGAAMLLSTKIKTGETGDIGDAIDASITSLRAEIAQGALWDEATPTINDAEKQTGRMVAAYNIFVAPRIRPVAVELEMTARFSPTLRLVGHMDVCENEEIRDTKTGIHRRPNHPQYGAYALLRRTHGHTVTRFWEDYVPRTAAKKVQGEPLSFEYPVGACEQSATKILKRADAAIQEFAHHGDPWAFIPNPASSLCGSKWCPAHGTRFCKVHS